MLDIHAEVEEMCDPPCENGTCAANNTCNCFAGYQGERCTEEGRLCNLIKYKFFQAPRCLAQLSIACSVQAMESWAGPGNEARYNPIVTLLCCSTPLCVIFEGNGSQINYKL